MNKLLSITNYIWEADTYPHDKYPYPSYNIYYLEYDKLSYDIKEEINLILSGQGAGGKLIDKRLYKSFNFWYFNINEQKPENIPSNSLFLNKKM